MYGRTVNIIFTSWFCSIWIWYGHSHSLYQYTIVLVFGTMFFTSSTWILQQQQQQHDFCGNDNSTNDANVNSNYGYRWSQQQQQHQQQQQQHHDHHDNKTHRSISYSQLPVHAFGTYGEISIKLGITIMQWGVCITYYFFVSHNLSVCVHIMTRNHILLSPSQWIVFMTLIEIPFSWVRNIHTLSPTNVMANVFILYGLMVCFSYANISCGCYYYWYS
jgi:hypothetical protein